jgi:DNA replicative helicase MCM subunit Mcm2 (Cdc46/Mcm family)
VKILINSQLNLDAHQSRQYSTITEKIIAQTDRITDSELIAPSFLKKYISYAKHTVFPKLSIEACEVLKDFYISLRQNATSNSNTLPITSR